MARRPARCYRYCKNKVSTISEITHKCAFCGRTMLLEAQASEGHCQLAFEYIAKSCFFHSHIPSPASTAVSQIPKFAFSIWAASVPTSMNSPSASTWSQMNTSNCLLKPSRPPVSARTSMFLPLPCTYHSHPQQQF